MAKAQLNELLARTFGEIAGGLATIEGIQQRYQELRYRDWETDRKSTRLNSSHRSLSRMPSSA